MSQWKLPVIDSKKNVGMEQQYNFVNKDVKKSKQNGALSMIEDLKRKIEQQKKQIENRNATIMGLQRNFQSLSGIVKHEKAQSAALKAQLQNLRQNSETGDKRASQFHEKCILLQNQNKQLKQQLNNVKRSHSECYKIANQSDIYKNKIMELEQIIQKFSGKLDALSQDKKILQSQLLKNKSQQKSKRQLQQRVVDLEEQLKKSMDINNALNDKIKILEDKINEGRTNNKTNEAKLMDLIKKIKQQQGKRKIIENQCENLKKQLINKEQQHQNLKRNMQTIGVYSKMKEDQDQKNKQQLRLIRIKCDDYKQQLIITQQNLSITLSQSNKKSQTLKGCEKQLQLLRQQVMKITDQFKMKQKKYLEEKQNLTKLASDLNRQLDKNQGENKQLNKKLYQQENAKNKSDNTIRGLEHELTDINNKMLRQQKYSKYHKMIDENETKGIIITNNEQLQRMQSSASMITNKLNEALEENIKNIQSLTEDNLSMKKYISSLEAEVNSKSNSINDKDKQIRNLTNKLDILNEQQKRLAFTIADQRKKTQQLKKQTEQIKLKTQKEIEQERQQAQKKIEQEKRKAQKYKQMINEFQQEEEKLKKLMANEHDNIKNLAKNKEDEINQIIKQKQLQIQKERKNNKLLWTDNKKLKQMEQKLKEQAEQQMRQIEKNKLMEIEKLKRDLQRKYDQQINMQKQQQSNSNQLKKILQQKALQVKTITENHNKTKTELQFYKNRNKQLEGVVSRTEKNFKDQLTALEKEIKTNKEVISVLDKKNTQINLVKQEIEKKCKSDVERLNQQINYMKLKYEGQRIEQKISLLKKSMSQFQTVLKAIGNSLSCNYCLEPVKECVRLKQCSHIYCKKCKAGYQPNCGECKKTSQQMTDKVIDDTVSKSQYMKILLNTVQDDLSKISL